LTDKQRTTLHAICRRREVDALVWKRARAFILLDSGYDAKTICEILDIGPTVLTEWKFAFAGAGLSFFGLHIWSSKVEGIDQLTLLISPIYVKPFAKQQKSDAADTEAIAAPASLPTMRFVVAKKEQQ
jgi:hypothetical protein